MAAPEKIHQLIEQFENNLDAYKRGNYNETQVRLEFIDPFFKELGWDVHNESGYAEAFKDVIHEDAIKVGGATKAPDYCFRIGGTRKFFLEAKKPSVNIKGDVHPAYQLRRYAWSAKLPLSILTDFEEFAVYECRKRPAKTDQPSTDRIFYCTFREYPEHWEEISAIFSKEAVLKGNFDRFVEKETKRPTSEVDREFLKEIESWREQLAKNIALRNPQLGVRELNYAVQLTIDRIIFLRICEDRGIETYGQLLALCGGPRIYPRLLEIFYRADDKYNSGLFHFREEKGRHSHSDVLTPALLLDDKVLKTILSRLYYPECPYEFSVMPAEILGNVYEQFLGKVIRLTAGHQAKIEEKPEVRKAGGVYYTPKYIVDYIVQQTVGKLCAGKTPRQIEKLRILDPACGSGSFLLGAFQYLLDYHRDYYEIEIRESGFSKRHQQQIYQGRGGGWLLTTAEKKRILLNNIYGVDIDEQAVEVTKLSLLLKVLENENQDTLERQLTLWRERALPDLGENIKCGNSLIGSDFYRGQQMNLFDPEEQRRINAFDWEVEFPGIFPPSKGGRGDVGFDAVIGNPPYVRSINLKESYPQEWNYYKEIFKTASFREWDIYLVFVEMGLKVLNSKGRLGFILPNKFLNSKVGEGLREILSNGKHLEQLIHFEAFQIFQGATTYTCLLFLGKSQNETAIVKRYRGPISGSMNICSLPEEKPDFWTTLNVDLKALSSDFWNFSSTIIEKLKKWPTLGEMANIFQGTGTRADKVYTLEIIEKEADNVKVFSSELNTEVILEHTYLKPVFRGRSINRYEAPEKNLVLIVPYEITNNKVRLVSIDEIIQNAPLTYDYLRNCQDRLNKREKGRFKGKEWHQYGRPQNLSKFEVPLKIVFPDIVSRGTCYLDSEKFWLLDTVYAITVKPSFKLDLHYIAAIMNSNVMTYFLKETGTPLRGGYFRMKTAFLTPFPIRTINFSDPADKARHDRIVQLVETMLNLHKRLQSAALPQEKTHLQRQITAADRQIDQLVYELYDLTPEEIRIVEDAVGG